MQFNGRLSNRVAALFYFKIKYMEHIENRLVALGYDRHEAIQIVDFYERKGKTVALIEYLNCMEQCNLRPTDIDECLTTFY